MQKPPVRRPGGADELQTEYALLRELGRGGSAVVYLARDREADREVAIKLIHASLLADTETLHRFEHEARTAALLQHPNIVGVHAVKRLRSGSLAMVMQYVGGGTLKRLIRERAPLGAPEVERIVRDIGAALAYAHRRGIVHRDVKPENIFLDPGSGRALLSDFGIAHTAEAPTGLTMHGVTVGTPAYMAPEQIDGVAIDGRADLYSLALVAWEMLTGEVPWEGESLYGIVHKQKHETLQPVRAYRSGVPRYLIAAIETAMAKDPDQRFPHAEAMLASLTRGAGLRFWSRWFSARRLRSTARAAHSTAAAPAWGRSSAPTETAPTAASQPGSAAEASLATVRFPRRPEPDTRGAERLTPPPGAAVPAASARRPPRHPRLAAVMLPGVAAVSLLIGAALYAASIATPEPAPRRDRAVAVQPTGRGASLPQGFRAPRIAGWAAGATDPRSPSADPLELQLAAWRPAAARPTEATSTDPGTGFAASPAARRGRPGHPPPGEPPARVVGLTAGGAHTCAVADSGALFCWGANGAGQLGTQIADRIVHPAAALEGYRFRDLAAGFAHTCGVTHTAQVICWGSNRHGQLGAAHPGAGPAPVRPGYRSRFQRVGAGTAHSCGLTLRGEVECWGDNSLGQLGGEAGGSHGEPVRAGRGGFIALAVGSNHACAVDAAGRAYCWGANGAGQLGNGGTADARSPTRSATSASFVQVVAGGAHSCGLTAHGTAVCWGENSSGQLGDGSTRNRRTPVGVRGGYSFVMLAAGGAHTCGLLGTGEALCWGRNSSGQLGDGSYSSRNTPAPIDSTVRLTGLFASGAHSCGISTAGEPFCWGANLDGQLGDGGRRHQVRPVRAGMPGA